MRSVVQVVLLVTLALYGTVLWPRRLPFCELVALELLGDERIRDDADADVHGLALILKAAESRLDLDER